MSFTHEHSWTLVATPTLVFRALTEPTALTTWFAEGAQVEPHVGGVYRFWGRHTLATPPQDAARQTITRYEPDTALGFDWPINEVATSVLVLLQPVTAGTRLTLTHTVYGDVRLPGQRERISDFWRVAMGNLSSHLGSGTEVRLPDYFSANP